MKNTKSAIKGNNFEVKYRFTDKSGVINEDSQTILAKDEKEAIEQVREYLKSIEYVTPESIEILKTNEIPSEDKKKCFKITYTWEDDKGNTTKLSEKVFAKDPEQAKKMIVDYTQKRHKFMVSVIIKQVNEIIDGKEELVEDLACLMITSVKKNLVEATYQEPEKIPDYIRKSEFEANIVSTTVIPKSGIQCATIKLEVSGGQVANVLADLMKFKANESLIVSVTPFQMVIGQDTPKEDAQLTIDDLQDEAETAEEQEKELDKKAS